MKKELENKINEEDYFEKLFNDKKKLDIVRTEFSNRFYFLMMLVREVMYGRIYNCDPNFELRKYIRVEDWQKVFFMPQEAYIKDAIVMPESKTIVIYFSFCFPDRHEIKVTLNESQLKDFQMYLLEVQNQYADTVHKNLQKSTNGLSGLNVCNRNRRCL